MMGNKSMTAGTSHICWSQTSSFPLAAVHHHQNITAKSRVAAAVRLQQCRHICRAAAAEDTYTIISSSTAIELRRNVLMQQLLEETPSSSSSSSALDDEPLGAAGGSSSSKRKGSRSQRSRGFATASANGTAAGSNRMSHPAADAACLCGSRLKYKDCCHPFTSGAATPRSAVDLVSSRITAAKTGNAAYLAATTHSDSNLALGGARDMAGRARRTCAYFRTNKFEVIGMAHCPGDASGTWVVLAVLQATAGEFAGEKAAYMELVARKNYKDPAAAGRARATAAGSSGYNDDQDQDQDLGSQPWMFLRTTHQFPQSGQSDVLIHLIQRHCPELLTNRDDDEQQQQQGLTERDRSFAWTTCNLHLISRHSSSSSSSSSSGSSSNGSNSDDSDQPTWHVDLLDIQVEPLGSRGQQQQQVAAAAAASQMNGQRVVINDHRILTPPGVFIMDEYIEQQAQRQK